MIKEDDLPGGKFRRSITRLCSKEAFQPRSPEGRQAEAQARDWAGALRMGPRDSLARSLDKRRGNSPGKSATLRSWLGRGVSNNSRLQWGGSTSSRGSSQSSRPGRLKCQGKDKK